MIACSEATPAFAVLASSGARGHRHAPERQASRTASTFECTPSFARTFLTWLWTVIALIARRAAISSVAPPIGQQLEHLELARA